MQRMKELKTIKEYSNKLLGIANKIKLLGNEFSDSRLVEKILVTMPERWGIYCFLRKHKRFVYNHLYRGDTCLASTRTTKIDEDKSDEDLLLTTSCVTTNQSSKKIGL